MTWIRLDDTFFDHPKTLELLDKDPMAALFHMAGLCWCSHRLTDGRVPDSAIHLIASQSHTPPSVVDVLEMTGHWARHEDGRSWQIVNYLDWQESRASIEVKRERERQKKRDQRASPPLSPGESPGDTSESPAATEVRGESSDLQLSVEEVEVDDGFECFWQHYPKRDGKRVGKAEAHDVWKRMSVAQRSAAMVGVENYAGSGWRPKDAHRWLSKAMWRDWQEPATLDEAPTPKQRVG